MACFDLTSPNFADERLEESDSESEELELLLLDYELIFFLGFFDPSFKFLNLWSTVVFRPLSSMTRLLLCPTLPMLPIVNIFDFSLNCWLSRCFSMKSCFWPRYLYFNRLSSIEFDLISVTDWFSEVVEVFCWIWTFFVCSFDFFYITCLKGSSWSHSPKR